MEQQSISIAKAGVIAQLKTRSSIIAAANSKGGKRYNNELSIVENIQVPGPLLSRFDLVFVLQDPFFDEEWNKKLSDYILEKEINSQNDNIIDNKETQFNYLQPWNLSNLQAYIEIVKQLTPIFTTESAL